MNTLVLLSGGLDSAVLAAHEAQHATVQPVYVSVGLAWEAGELAMVDRLLTSPAVAARMLPLARVEFTMRDVYPPTHWAIRGVPPAYDTPDEDVYLAGRNLVLLTKAAVVAARSNAHRIAIGPLAGNPFPDARPEFFAAMTAALSLGLGHAIQIVTPFLEWRKEQVIRRGAELGVPFELTLSCMNPGAGASGASGALPRHCGLCSKCRERRDAFAAAGITDPSTYANPSPRLARNPEDTGESTEMPNEDSKSEERPAVAPAHTHEWTHDDVEPTIPPVSVSTCTCGAIRRSWQDDEGEFREEISYLS